MKKYQIIMQDEYNNLWNLGFYNTLEESIKDINEWLKPYETTIDNLETYVSSFNVTFDKEIETKDGNIVMVRGFMIYDCPIMLKHYNNEEINKELEKMLEWGFVRDKDEFKERFECGGDFEILIDNIDKILAYVENDYQGELYLNSNIYWLCEESLVNILKMYGLRLIGEQKVTENEKVVRIDENLSS